MRKLLVFFLSILAINQLVAQKPFKKNTLYVELAGNGLVLSANYERQLGNKPGLGLYIGMGLGNYKPVIPLGVKYLIDFGNHKSFLEAGAGITLAEREIWDEFPVHDNKNPYKAGFIPSLGYRHQTRHGLMLRLNYTPFFTEYRNYFAFYGLSVGWRL
jgi:hypothetical protein